MDNDKKLQPVLLFDLGGVITDIKRERCAEAFRRLGMPDPDAFLGEYAQKGPFLQLEEGALTSGQFRNEIRALIPHEVTDAQIDEAFVQFIVGIPVDRLRKLEELHRRYPLYVLSNTNPIMWNTVLASEFRKDGHDINYYFDGIVTSFEAKCCKPDARIFEEVLGKFNLVPEQVTFFDDSQANCDAARALGFKAVWVDTTRDFSKLVDEAVAQIEADNRK